MSQVNFYMTSEDDAAFTSFVLSNPTTAIVKGRFYPTPTPPPILAMPAFGADEDFELVNLALGPVLCSARGVGETEGLYLFDMFRDVHIEFSRCYVKDGALQRGRIYCKAGWLQEEDRNRAFSRWYQSLARWIKRSYRNVGKHYWLGPGAVRWVTEGGSITPRIELLEQVMNNGAA